MYLNKIRTATAANKLMLMKIDLKCMGLKNPQLKQKHPAGNNCKVDVR
jgi:hypothetical protein